MERLTAIPAATSSLSGDVRRAAAGDLAAFEALVHASSGTALRTALAILGNESDARDATQDAFVSAWRELPRLRDPERFQGWFRQILLNACRAHLRRRRQVREISLDGTLVDPPSGSPGLPEIVGDSELLERAFERLDGDRRAILVLHYLEHRPVASIAADLGVAPGTVKWRLSEARSALARALTAEGEARR